MCFLIVKCLYFKKLHAWRFYELIEIFMHICTNLRKKEAFIKPFLFLHRCFHYTGSVVLNAFTGIYIMEMQR